MPPAARRRRRPSRRRRDSAVIVVRDAISRPSPVVLSPSRARGAGFCLIQARSFPFFYLCVNTARVSPVTMFESTRTGPEANYVIPQDFQIRFGERRKPCYFPKSNGFLQLGERGECDVRHARGVQETPGRAPSEGRDVPLCFVSTIERVTSRARGRTAHWGGVSASPRSAKRESTTCQRTTAPAYRVLAHRAGVVHRSSRSSRRSNGGVGACGAPPPSPPRPHS